MSISNRINFIKFRINRINKPLSHSMIFSYKIKISIKITTARLTSISGFFKNQSFLPRI